MAFGVTYLNFLYQNKLFSSPPQIDFNYNGKVYN